MSDLVPICRLPGCAEKVYFKGRKDMLCKNHWMEDRDRQDRVAAVLVEKYLVRQFSEEEIAELVGRDVYWVKSQIQKIRAENAEWLQATGADRMRLVINELVRNSKDRQNELWITVANDSRSRVKALKELRAEDKFAVELLQGLGYLPKAAEQVAIHHSVESILLSMDTETERAKNDIVVEGDVLDEIPVLDLDVDMELLYDAAVSEKDLKDHRSANRRADAALPSGSEKVLRKPFVDQLKVYGEIAAASVSCPAVDLQRDPAKEKGQEAGPPADPKSPPGWSIHPDGGVPVHQGRPLPPH